MFTSEERERYEIQFELPGFGLEGQMKLKQSKVMVIGAGGLGCPALQYLSAAGIGMLGLADGAAISLNDLQCQVLYGIDSQSKNKAEVASQKIKLINNNILYNCYPYHLTRDSARSIIRIYDVIIDCTNNIESAELIGTICQEFEKPLVQAFLYEYQGQLGVFNQQGSKGYLQAPVVSPFAKSKSSGSFGFFFGIMGSLMASEAIKIVSGMGSNLAGKTMKIDFLTNRFSIESNN